MLKVTQKQRDNAIHARDVLWPSVPAASVDLVSWSSLGDERDIELSDANCGTLACFGGWCAADPYFKEQGLSLAVLRQYWRYQDLDENLFGCDEMFNAAGSGPERSGPEPDWDNHIESDHALVAWRLNWLIENSEVYCE